MPPRIRVGDLVKPREFGWRQSYEVLEVDEDMIRTRPLEPGFSPWQHMHQFRIVATVEQRVEAFERGLAKAKERLTRLRKLAHAAARAAARHAKIEQARGSKSDQGRG